MAKTVTVAIVGYTGCSAWITAGLLELFAIANNARATLPDGRGASAARFDCHIVSATGRPVRGSHGVTFAVHACRRRYDAAIVPPIWCESLADLEERAQRLRTENAFMVRMARRSKIFASTCSGAVLLAQAGLLSGRRATTCWWLVNWFRLAFPDVEMVPDRLVMHDRELWTAAAGTAYMHLALELVRELAGEPLASATGRLMLVERRRGSQSPFLVPHAAPQQGSEIERAMRYLRQHAGKRLAIAGVCRTLAVSERTLARRFKASLGMSPLSYLQSQRIARARELLEGSKLPLDRIVEQCGYEDVSSFRKLFARQVGMTPRDYRQRFGNG
ncbi:MAG TPA: helix-turn-helix domain-containing protein [Steroidobacteraceae bacterium]|jgi:transcriptional regulator GlxA family with amidase domain|nr:helix-turn-helix domain-containing protein [Steroidobacteraceae bacterium]